MKTQKLKAVLLLLASATLSIFINAQSLKINPANSQITILGTSNLHNWETKTKQINGQIAANITSKQIQSLVVEIPVKSLKSGEKLMDTKTYEAFNAEKNPNILFKMTEVNDFQIVDNNINVIVTGNLTLAGVTKKLTFKAVGKPQKNSMYNFVGNLNLKMTDFQIKPPTAMMGMLKVGDAISLKLDVNVEGIQLTQL